MARTKQTAKKSNGGEAPRMSVAKLGKLKGLPKRRKALRASVELGESAKVVHCPAENEVSSTKPNTRRLLSFTVVLHALPRWR
jgi:hypothetical protein